MTTDLTTKLYLSAMDAIERGPRRYTPVPEAERVCAPNPADTCDCGAESEHTEYRNGREIGVCASCK